VLEGVNDSLEKNEYVSLKTRKENIPAQLSFLPSGEAGPVIVMFY
jgi:hypothetical protein